MTFIEGVLWCCGFLIVTLFAGQLGVQELQRMNAVAAFRTEQVFDAPVDVGTDQGDIGADMGPDGAIDGAADTLVECTPERGEGEV